MLARFPPSYKDFSCFLAMRAGGPESARRRLSLIPSLVLRGRGLKDSHTVLPDQPSLELGSRPLHTVRGPWVDGEPVGKTAAVPSPAGHGLSVLSGEATYPERPWAGRALVSVSYCCVTEYPQMDMCAGLWRHLCFTDLGSGLRLKGQ